MEILYEARHVIETSYRLDDHVSKEHEHKAEHTDIAYDVCSDGLRTSDIVICARKFYILHSDIFWERRVPLPFPVIMVYFSLNVRLHLH